MRPIPVDTLAGFRVPELDEPVVGRRQEVIPGVVEITVLEFKFRIISSENCAMVNLRPVNQRSDGSKNAISSHKLGLNGHSVLPKLKGLLARSWQIFFS